MQLSNIEKDIIISSLKAERKRVEKEYIESMKKEINKNSYNNDDITYGVAERFLLLQRFNSLIIKFEDDLNNR